MQIPFKVSKHHILQLEYWDKEKQRICFLKDTMALIAEDKTIFTATVCLTFTDFNNLEHQSEHHTE